MANSSSGQTRKDLQILKQQKEFRLWKQVSPSSPLTIQVLAEEDSEQANMQTEEQLNTAVDVISEAVWTPSFQHIKALHSSLSPQMKQARLAIMWWCHPAQWDAGQTAM